MYEIHQVDPDTAPVTPRPVEWIVESDLVKGAVAPGGRLFMRRGKTFGDPESHETMWLVGELDGVRVYMEQDHDGRVGFYMTKADLYP